jgi:hypothetical protein
MESNVIKRDYIDRMYPYDICSEVNDFFSKKYALGTPGKRIQHMKAGKVKGVKIEEGKKEKDLLEACC